MTTRLILILGGLLLACEEKDRIEGTEPGDCTDSADNDGDGLFDCNDDGCAGSPDCSDSGAEDSNNSNDEDDSDTTDTTDTDDTDDTTVESPSWTGVWRVDMNLNFSCEHSFGGETTADEDNDQQTIMLQLSGPPNDLYAVTPGTDSSWSMSGSGDESGIFLGGSIRMEVDGDPIDWDSNVTIAATEIISANEVHGTIFGSFSANSSWWECEFKDEPSTVVLTQ